MGPYTERTIGTPQGYSPGRVVWSWNANVTEDDLTGYWWQKENNDQAVIDQMFSLGIRKLADANDDYNAWDFLFKYFNEEHGYGNVGYQAGEKIAIKINLNNCGSYTNEDNERDASPYVVKALLRQLVNIVNVDQEDIYIYDASRRIGNWFYNRVYYEEYPADPLVPEFPDVHYVDNSGGASGREMVVASSERVYFAAGTCAYRTLPTCVVDADYLINMPILKRHPINTGVTLSGKNFFGTWMEPVVDVHPYHELSFTLGNPAPQTDLFAHEHIGGKVVLYIGDGIFATPWDHAIIGKFQMYPFNDDWTNSLFFSQDPVAIDSVMYDFLLAEGTNPCEGSQNYLHQSAEPPTGVYDPENDGVYLSDSLGVHEHWDTDENIFSSERYSGPSNDGIDYIFADAEEIIVDAYGPYYGLINEPVQFNGFATGGYPPYSWEWDFGDSHTSDEQDPSHVYTIPGNYTVTLTVTDDTDKTGMDYTWSWIQENNEPPYAPNIDGPVGGKAGNSYGYTFSADDPEETIIWYYIDWGDETNTGWIGPFSSGEIITESHTWKEQNTYTIKAKAKDPYESEGPWGQLDVTMPKNMAVNKPFLRFLENYPILFPILRYILGLQ